MRSYTKRFFSIRESKALQSAQEIVPIVMKYVNPGSVIDIGCGNGAWLSIFSRHGLMDFLGVDGGTIDDSNLLIMPEKFTRFDLSKGAFNVERQFDLVMSLEVAEHIPAGQSEQFVKMLTNMGDVVMFSAAVPGQGGVDHINEQWQGYWADIFQKFGYVPVDFVRALVWENPNVQYWYKQNIILYCKEEISQRFPKDKAIKFLNVVHPDMYDQVANFFVIRLLMKIYFFVKKVYLRLPI